MIAFPYWTVFVLIAGFTLFETFPDSIRYRRIIAILLSLFLVLFVGLRFESVDYYSYLGIWENASFKYFSIPLFRAPSVGGTTGNEFLFASAICSYKFLGLSFESFIFSVSLISLSIKFYFFRRYTILFSLCILLYLSMGLFVDTSQIRNGFAASILLFSIEPIYKRQLFRYLLVIISAFGVHSFAIISLPLYWLYPILRNKLLSTILLIFAFAVSTAGGSLSPYVESLNFLPFQIKTKIFGYFFGLLNQPLNYNALNISFFVFAVFLIWLGPVLARKLYFAPVLITWHTFSVFIYFISFDFSIVAGRIFELLSFNSIIILASLSSQLFNGLNRYLFVFGIILYSSLLFFSYVSNPFLPPYQNILLR